MAYELWNQDTANIIGEFDSEDASLAFVRRSIEQHGSAVAERWALAFEDDAEDTRPIVAGRALIERARKAIPA